MTGRTSLACIAALSRSHEDSVGLCAERRVAGAFIELVGCISSFYLHLVRTSSLLRLLYSRVRLRLDGWIRHSTDGPTFFCKPQGKHVFRPWGSLVFGMEQEFMCNLYVYQGSICIEYEHDCLPRIKRERILRWNVPRIECIHPKSIGKASIQCGTFGEKHFGIVHRFVSRVRWFQIHLDVLPAAL